MSRLGAPIRSLCRPQALLPALVVLDWSEHFRLVCNKEITLCLVWRGLGLPGVLNPHWFPLSTLHGLDSPSLLLLLRLRPHTSRLQYPFCFPAVYLCKLAHPLPISFYLFSVFPVLSISDQLHVICLFLDWTLCNLATSLVWCWEQVDEASSYSAAIFQNFSIEASWWLARGVLIDFSHWGGS